MIKCGDEAVWRVVETDAGAPAWREVQPLVRCRDCANMTGMGGGSGHCAWWGRYVPLDGHCHNGVGRSEDGE